MVFKRSLTLKNDVQEVDQIVPVVQAACEAVGFDELTTVQMNLAVEECVVNVVDYAYPEDTQGDIMVDVEANERGLRSHEKGRCRHHPASRRTPDRRTRHLPYQIDHG